MGTGTVKGKLLIRRINASIPSAEPATTTTQKVNVMKRFRRSEAVRAHY